MRKPMARTVTCVEFCPHCMVPRNMRGEQGKGTCTGQGAVNRAAIFVRYHCEACGLFVRLKTQDPSDVLTSGFALKQLKWLRKGFSLVHDP
jgi:hypothetical protein